jgi:membrane-associated phospholipid phosphatase
LPGTGSSTRFPPFGWRAFGLQLLLLLAVDVTYEVSRALLEGPSAAALAHAADIVRAERRLGIFVERDLQRWAISAPGFVMDAADWVYRNCQRLVAWLFVVWVYLWRNPAYTRLRNRLIILDALGLIGYWLYPTAPPRLTSGLGFVDTLDPSHANLHSSLFGSLTNLYAAVPSLHTAYALLIGITGVRVGRHLVTRVFWGLWPAVVVFSTVVTANHWLLDAAAGAVVLGIAWLLADAAEARWRWVRRPLETRRTAVGTPPNDPVLPTSQGSA